MTSVYSGPQGSYAIGPIPPILRPASCKIANVEQTGARTRFASVEFSVATTAKNDGFDVCLQNARTSEAPAVMGFALKPAGSQWCSVNISFSNPFDPSGTLDTLKYPNIPNPNGESVLLFCSYAAAPEFGGSFQGTRLRTLYESGTMKEILRTSGMAVLAEMVSLTSKTPISYAKIYWNGYITVPGEKEATVYDASDIKFTYLQLVAASTPFPQPKSNHLMGYMFATRQAHRSLAYAVTY